MIYPPREEVNSFNCVFIPDGVLIVSCVDPSSPLFSALPAANHINKVVSHPTLPITITAHEDRNIKFFDNKSGKWAGGDTV